MKYNSILWLGENYKDYHSAYYQNDILKVFKENYDIHVYGPGYRGYNPRDSIHEILRKTITNPDLIVISNTWENQDPSVDRFPVHTGTKLNEVDIPKLQILNKEYKKLDTKLQFISKNNVDYVTTVVKKKCKEWQKMTGAEFIWEPFGVDLHRFKHDANMPKKYDFGFTGSLHEKWLDERLRIKKHLFKKSYLEFRLWHNFVHKQRFKNRYNDLDIYWGEWNNKTALLKSRAPFGKRYVELLNSCDMYLNTLSAFNIFNPRFWELMATKTLIICPDADYSGLLEDGSNCVMYNNLHEFDEILYYYATNEQARRSIVATAYEQVQQYSWDCIVEDLMSQIAQR
jgi:hypothetical protein